MARRLRVTLVPAGLALGIAAELVSYRSGELDGAAADLLVGWVLIGSGLLAWERRGDSRVGPLLAATGVAWFLGSFWTAALYLHRGPLVHALLSFPSGRLSGRVARAVVGLAYLDGVIEPLGQSATATLVLWALVAATAIHGYLSETGARRRARAVATVGTLAIAAVLSFGALGRLAGWGADATTLWAYEVVLAVVAVALVADLLRGRWSQGALTGLVVDLGGLWEPVTLRDRLARALGDRSLQLGYWIGADAGYVDEAGRPFVVPNAGSTQAVTPIERDGERVAVLVHDPAALQDRAVLDAVAAATRIAVANVRLQAQVHDRVEQVAVSRRRIVDAADAQRRRLAGELHEGAEQRLATVSEQVAALARYGGDAGARELLAGVQNQLDSARAELGRLARGIRPATLTSGGLAAALSELAAHASVPVETNVDAGRLSPAVEAAAYFVCGEALANVEKYADASRVQINVRHEGGRLAVAVTDDGVGGADPSRGSGLRGLADRVEALGGQLMVESPPGSGTRLIAEIPGD